jgi:hypothetical protein
MDHLASELFPSRANLTKALYDLRQRVSQRPVHPVLLEPLGALGLLVHLVHPMHPEPPISQLDLLYHPMLAVRGSAKLDSIQAMVR